MDKKNEEAHGEAVQAFPAYVFSSTNPQLRRELYTSLTHLGTPGFERLKQVAVEDESQEKAVINAWLKRDGFLRSDSSEEEKEAQRLKAEFAALRKAK